MGVLEPVPYMGVWEPYMGVRLWAEVIPLCLLAPLQTSRRVVNIVLTVNGEGAARGRGLTWW